MDDPLAVRRLETFRHLTRHIERLRHGQRPLEQALREREAGHQLHHQYRRGVG